MNWSRRSTSSLVPVAGAHLSGSRLNGPWSRSDAGLSWRRRQAASTTSGTPGTTTAVNVEEIVRGLRDAEFDAAQRLRRGRGPTGRGVCGVACGNLAARLRWAGRHPVSGRVPDRCSYPPPSRRAKYRQPERVPHARSHRGALAGRRVAGQDAARGVRTHPTPPASTPPLPQAARPTRSRARLGAVLGELRCSRIARASVGAGELAYSDAHHDQSQNFDDQGDR